MALLPIRIYPDPVLRLRCAAVTEFDHQLRQLAADMIATVHAAPGLGLAAPQVGVGKRLIVVDTSVGSDPQTLHVLVNPVLSEKHGKSSDFEGCLSLPGLSEKVERPTEVRVVAQDLEGRDLEVRAEELDARVICHEIDHLDGVLFFDHLRGLRRDRIRRQLRRMSRPPEVPPPVAFVSPGSQEGYHA